MALNIHLQASVQFNKNFSNTQCSSFLGCREIPHLQIKYGCTCVSLPHTVERPAALCSVRCQWSGYANRERCKAVIHSNFIMLRAAHTESTYFKTCILLLKNQNKVLFYVQDNNKNNSNNSNI